MIINGINYKVLPDFSPDMRLALKWTQLSNGDWYAIDRTASDDIYSSHANFYGKEADINALINEIEANRTSGNNVLAISGISSTEKLFGADIDYTGVVNVTTDTVQAMRRTQGTWRGWGVSLGLIALSPSFLSIPSTLPPFRLIGIGVDADSDRTIDKSASYNNTFSMDDRAADYGTFKGQFTFTMSEMARLRRAMAATRGGNFTIPKLEGIVYPFGRRSSANPTNFPVKIIAWENEKMRDITRWTVDITMAEVI